MSQVRVPQPIVKRSYEEQDQAELVARLLKQNRRPHNEVAIVRPPVVSSGITPLAPIASSDRGHTDNESRPRITRRTSSPRITRVGQQKHRRPTGPSETKTS